MINNTVRVLTSAAITWAYMFVQTVIDAHYYSDSVEVEHYEVSEERSRSNER